MSTVAWSGGKIVGANDPLIGALHHGFTVGDGVFETIGIRNRRPFAITRHIARLQDALTRVGLGRVNEETLQEGIQAVLEAGEGRLTRLRITAASGSGPVGLARTTGPLTLVIVGGEGTRPPACTAIRLPWRRNEYSPLVGVKTISAGENAVMAAYASRKGADEGFLANSQGDLCEAISANAFVERDGEVLTPPLASGCLPGVTRALALEWGAAEGIPVRTAAPGELPYSALDRVADRSGAAAVSSATRGIQQVTIFEGVDVQPGPLLGRLKTLWEKRADEDPDPAPLPG